MLSVNHSTKSSSCDRFWREGRVADRRRNRHLARRRLSRSHAPWRESCHRQLNAEAGEAVVKTIKDDGGEASFIRTDVSSEDQRGAPVDHAVSGLRPPRLCIQQRRIGGAAGPLADQSTENYDKVMAINVSVRPAMNTEDSLKTGGGAIVNMSAAWSDSRGSRFTARLKHAVMGLPTKSAAHFETIPARGIRVNAVNPGRHSHPDGRGPGKNQHRAGWFRHIRSVESASRRSRDVVLWLCSEQASFVTGTGDCVDGGFTAQ